MATDKTIEAAVIYLIDKIDDLTKERIRGLIISDLNNLHFNLGLGIRNSLGLWVKNAELLKDCKRKLNYPEYMDIHADTASSVIIEKLWKRLKTVDSSISKEN